MTLSLALLVVLLLLLLLMFFFQLRTRSLLLLSLEKSAVTSPEGTPVSFDPTAYEAQLAQVSASLEQLRLSHQNLDKDLSKNLSGLFSSVRELPSKTLSTIQGSINNTTGKMGEMMQLIELQRTYDRLIVVGDIVDFIGIRFPSGDNPGAVDFIDIKTGKSAALSSDQRKFRDLISATGSEISFKVVKVQIT